MLNSKKMLSSHFAFAATLLSLSPFAAFATPDVQIIQGSLKVQGPGCPYDGSVFADVINGTTVQFIFNDLMAAVSQGTNLVEQKNCVATVDVKVPDGYQVAPGPVFMEATVNGISETGSATAYARYYIAGKASEFISKNVSSADFPNDGTSLDLRLQSANASTRPDSWSGTCGGIQKLSLQSRAIARRGSADVGFTEILIDRAVGGTNRHIACKVVVKPCGAP